jgi:hypothetical protein
MAPTAAYNVASRVMCEAKNLPVNGDKLFGDVVVLFGGDFRQLTPIPGDGESMEEIHFRNSTILERCVKLQLTENMRADPTQAEFAALLKRIGEGEHPTLPNHPPTCMAIPKDWIAPDNNLYYLIDWIFEDDPTTYGRDRSILTQTNDDCRKVNMQVRIKKLK